MQYIVTTYSAEGVNQINSSVYSWGTEAFSWRFSSIIPKRGGEAGSKEGTLTK